MDSWEANTRRKYGDEIGRVREILERMVRKNPGEAHTWYGSLFVRIPTLSQELSDKQHPLYDILGCIPIDTHREQLGMLSVIVWNKQKSRPGRGFYDVARQYCGWRRSDSEEEIFSEEFRRVHEAYAH